MLPRVLKMSPNCSARDTVAEVRHAGGLHHANELHLRYAGLEAVEQALTRAEDHRRDLQIDLVDQASLDRLAGTRCATGDRDVLPAGGRLSLCVGGFDAVGDEMERGAAVHLDRVVG